METKKFPYWGWEETAITGKFCWQCGQDLLPDVSFKDYSTWWWNLSIAENQDRSLPAARYCERHLNEFWEFVPEKRNAHKHVFPHWILRKGVEMDEDGTCWWRQDWKLHPAVQEHRKVFWDQNRRFEVLPSHQIEATRAAFNDMARRQAQR